MDLISRQAAIEAVDFGITYAKAIDIETGEVKELFKESNEELTKAAERIKQLPPAQPFYNITMTDVMKYIDDMPEDVWLEFTECLGCRGWELQRRTAKWCGGDFA